MPRIVTTEIGWPQRGIHKSLAFHRQPPETTPSALNVRSFDPVTGRSRGSQRAGISKYLAAQLNSSNAIQCLDTVTTSSAYASATSMVVRSVVGVGVAGGTVKKFTSAGFTAATNGSSALSSTAPVIFSAELFGVVYFADGTNTKKWTASTNTVAAWSASAGTFPTNGGTYPRLIEMWRGRIIMAGLVGDEHNWFMSKLGDATNFDYTGTDEDTAVAGNNSKAGKMGDIINCIIPWSDEICLFGGDHSIWIFYSDPAAGGRLAQLTNITGMAFGRPWCIDPYGNVWFFGSRGGVYRMVSGNGLPERMTADTIDEELAEVDLTKVSVRMEWNDREQGVHLFLTDLTGGTSSHYFYDVRNQAWWKDQLGSVSYNPVCTLTMDGDTSSDRAMLMGCRDGYLRKWDIDADDDDSTAIDSYCYIPITAGKHPGKLLLRELQPVLANNSGQMYYQGFCGPSTEDAVNAGTASFSGIWREGRNPSLRRGMRGDAMFLKVGGNLANSTWALESLRAQIELVNPGLRGVS